MTVRTLVFAAAALLALCPGTARAATAPSGIPSAAEQPFVDSVAADLTARFPTPESARAAGYLRFTDEDETGAISYANRQWTSADSKHPSQLWYDVKGRLIGADFSVPYTDTRPKLFGVDPARWEKFGAHVHFGLVAAGGTKYGAIGATAITKAGGSAGHPTATQLVAAGAAKKISDVRFVFAFPAIWDLQLWVIPNPSGAFAASNPEVKPSTPKTSGM
jgi:hypothetical protein